MTYNIAATQFKWSPLSIDGRTTLLKIITVNGKMALDPYQVDAEGNRINKFQWENGSLFRLTNANLAIGTDLKSKEAKANQVKRSTKGTQDELDQINNHPDAYVDFNIPWKLKLNYVISLDQSQVNQPQSNQTQLKRTVRQSIGCVGQVNLTPKWKVGFSTGYDFVAQKATVTSIDVYRDLHCWEFKFNWVPFGFRRGFTVDLNVKSAMLKDLRLHKAKPYTDYL
jgi:hypothetical protein